MQALKSSVDYEIRKLEEKKWCRERKKVSSKRIRLHNSGGSSDKSSSGNLFVWFGCNRPNGVVKFESLKSLGVTQRQTNKRNNNNNNNKAETNERTGSKIFHCNTHAHKVFHPVCNKHISMLSLLLSSFFFLDLACRCRTKMWIWMMML